MSKCWVAKVSDNLGVLFEYELSPRFDSAIECMDYINNHLNSIEKDLTSAFNLINCNRYENGVKKYYFCWGGRFVRPYHIKQKRFADSFDY